MKKLILTIAAVLVATTASAEILKFRDPIPTDKTEFYQESGYFVKVIDYKDAPKSYTPKQKEKYINNWIKLPKKLEEDGVDIFVTVIEVPANK